jgi:hypothetical protein
LRKWQKIGGGADRRGHERSAVLVRAVLRTETSEIRCFLRNMSRSGALIDMTGPVEAETEVTLLVGASRIRARIAWVREERAGLEFAALLAEDEVAVHIGRPKAAMTARRLHG